MMATTMGPEMVAVDTPAHLENHGSHLPVPPLTDVIGSGQTSGDAAQPSPRSSPPLPNPPFVFPMRPLSASAPSTFRASGRRPRSAIETQERSFSAQIGVNGLPARSPALPDFSFNPGASLSPSPNNLLSPPQSPSSPMAIPTKPGGHGHRRGGSEFVGGNIRAGEAITVMSTSPTKSESGMASPQLMPTHPSGRPRGHRHQRSGAISNHDLSAILQPKSPNSSTRGNSAPASPADFQEKEHYAFPDTADAPEKMEEPKKEEVKSETRSDTVDSPASPVEASQTQKAVPRARVAFSDTLDFIPRPLSLVSSDTSSTVTVTGRPGHSVSGSISSIISTNSTIAEKDEGLAPLESSSSQNISDSRPSTAGAILERTQSFQLDDTGTAPPRRRGSLPLLMSLPPPEPTQTEVPTPSPTKTPKRWSFFGLEPFTGASSPTRPRPSSAGSCENASNQPRSRSSSAEQEKDCSAQVSDTEQAHHKSGSRKTGKKQRKVKSWAGSILTRKPKPRHSKSKKGSRRAPTPPPDRHVVDDDEDTMEDTADSVSEPTMPTVLVTETSSSQHGDADTWKPPRPLEDDDMTYPMIDLDAALGPFNTPLPRNPEWEAAQRAGGLTKRPLHSAAGLSRLGYVHHQRAQSSPEMVPFEHGRRSLNRFGSSSTMADVFEEEEEEDEDGDESRTSGKSTPLAEPSLDVASQISGISQATGPSDLSKASGDNASIASSGPRYKESEPDDFQKGRHAASMRSEPSLGSLHADIIVEEPTAFAAQRVDPPRCPTASSSDSAAPSPRFTAAGKNLSPVDVGPLYLPATSLAQISPYSATLSSSYPSPRSPISYDANRISTAPSSVTEDNFQSLLLGEPGPEVRVSVDIPSLTSSNSTMTRDSMYAQQIAQLSEPPARGERPASFTSSAFGVRRSSLASLSRLISSSHGERSKLSMEVTYNSDADEKRPKVSKTKRLGRMMQFWKPKEDSSST